MRYYILAAIAAFILAGWYKLLTSRRSEVRRVKEFLCNFIRSEEAVFLLMFLAYAGCVIAYEYYSKR